MVRSVVANNLQTLFTSEAKESYSLGVVVGQSLEDKDYVVYVGRIPLNHGGEGDVKGFKGIDETTVLDHARQISRMLPGGLHILGISVASVEDLTSPLDLKVKSLLRSLHSSLEANRYLYGNHNSQKLILNYSTKTMKFSCKVYNISTSSLQPADLKFSTKEHTWHRIDCTVFIDELYYFEEQDAKLSLEEHIKVVLKQINEKMDKMIFLIDKQHKDDDEYIDTYFKTGVRNKKQDITHLEALALQPGAVTDSKNLHKVIDSFGSLRMSGKVASRIWVQPKVTVKEVCTFLRQDIMRSLASRSEMHIDSLTEEENSEGINCIHEPPRRVMVSLPDIQPMFSDYLFPGEGPQDAKASLEELLHIKLKGKLFVEDLEGQADIARYYDNSTIVSESCGVIIKSHTTNSNNFIYVAGLVAIVILLIALLIHFSL